MNENEMFVLLLELWRDFRDPAFLWQVLALASSLPEKSRVAKIAPQLQQQDEKFVLVHFRYIIAAYRWV